MDRPRLRGCGSTSYGKCRLTIDKQYPGLARHNSRFVVDRQNGGRIVWFSQETSYPRGAGATLRMTTSGFSTPVRLMVFVLGVTAVWCFAWPVYRAFLNIEIDPNEGWNAYWADAAMGRRPLYPSHAELITNNYPPLSFYIVGGFGRLVGDPVLSGRLLSLMAVGALAVAVALAIRRLNGSPAGAAVGSLYFLATMSRFCPGYVGMNDPQLLAQAVMIFGFLGFLKATAQDRGYVIPILVMVLAGFIKHNIIAMPLTAYVWLAMQRPHQLLKCIAIGGGAAAVGLAVCAAHFGPDFLANMLSPRGYSIREAIDAMSHLQQIAVGLVAWAYVGWTRRADLGLRLCNQFAGIALAEYFLESTGAGVDINAGFDLVIAVSIIVGLFFSQAELLPLLRRFGAETVQVTLLIAICWRLNPSTHLKPFRLVFHHSGIHREIALREKAMADSVARVREAPGEVYAEPFITYRAGKPFTVDEFNSGQRIAAGALPRDAITSRVAAGTLTLVKTDPIAQWAGPLTPGH